MIFLSSFSDYLFYDMLAKFFHTTIEQVYLSLTVGIMAAAIVIAFVHWWLNR
ncbi:hypothetical protein LMB52_09315 [Limosilactobacillus reuteri]|uniref:hypothetical protein n=1 Tax=Limosilactobacillus reuteri TaxID=1598 RepID=UPI001E524D4C|nr:hypothetical protein [Limosilactobacillus reuteri]MCC4470030.1 hypothetical protein [Limosilactobacillus reuteri]